VGDYLGWDGFTAGCYYFMAHMNESFEYHNFAISKGFSLFLLSFSFPFLDCDYTIHPVISTVNR
jgi:hypothetical protein